MRPTVHPEALLVRSSLRYRPMSLPLLLPRILLWAILVIVFVAAILAVIHVLFPVNSGGWCGPCYHTSPLPLIEF